MEGHCMKCKEKRTMNLKEIAKTKRGGYMAKGNCATCNCGMCKIMSKDQATQAATAANLPLPA